MSRNEKKNQQEQREPFHGVDANRSATHCQCSIRFRTKEGTIGVRELRMSMVRGNLLSVRGYGLRTYESRQGRNAATVV